MGQLLITGIDEKVTRNLTDRARREGKTVEELAREVIVRNFDPERDRLSRRLDAIRRTTAGKEIVDPVGIVRRDRDRDHAG